jgi:hypothetical protein
LNFFISLKNLFFKSYKSEFGNREHVLFAKTSATDIVASDYPWSIHENIPDLEKISSITLSRTNIYDGKTSKVSLTKLQKLYFYLSKSSFSVTYWLKNPDTAPNEHVDMFPAIIWIFLA